MKNWFLYFLMFAFFAITSLCIIIFYNWTRINEREALDAYYTKQLQEELTPAYDESQMNPNAKM